VFLTPWYGGLGWRHLYYEQGIQHTRLIIKHLRTPGPFQSLLQISLQWYQVIAGVSFAPLSAPQNPLTYLDSAWLDSTREFLGHCSAHLDIPQIPLQRLKRVNDECIMDGLRTLDLPKKTLARLNFCRLWLQVTTLSDISSLSGGSIDRNAWLGLTPMPLSQDDWPVQQRPHDKIWSTWRKALSDSYCTKNHRRYVLASRPGQLKQHLGAWLQDSQIEPSPRWNTVFSHSTQRLYLPSPTEPGRYHQFSTSTRLDFSMAKFDLINPQTRAIPLPEDAVPAKTHSDGSFA
jgi:hypothetical protein